MEARYEVEITVGRRVIRYESLSREHAMRQARLERKAGGKVTVWKIEGDEEHVVSK